MSQNQSQAKNLSDNLKNLDTQEIDKKKDQSAPFISDDTKAKAKSGGVKALGLVAKISMTIGVTTAAVYTGVFLIGFMNVGMLAGLAIILGASLALMYVAKGFETGAWNPVNQLVA